MINDKQVLTKVISDVHDKLEHEKFNVVITIFIDEIDIKRKAKRILALMI
ncbi:hypothetical protein [Clostridium sp. D53t1_180928_C8]|nr:hypothetical protein [Clostridium sp. D53t1_180928_C8]